MKDKLSLFVKTAISLGLMAYLLYRFLSDPMDRAILVETLTTANLAYLTLALLLFILAIVTNAVKWYILLRAQGIPVPLLPVTNYTFVGFFFNNFLPANVGGDVIRGYGLARYLDRNAEAAVSVIVDRIIGLVAFMFTAVVAALVAVRLVPTDSENEATALLTENLILVEWISIFGMAVLLGGFAIMLSHRLRAMLGRLFELKPLVPLAPLYQTISSAFGAYRHQYWALIQAFCVGVVTVLLTGCVDIAIVAGLHGHINPIYIFLFNPIIAILLIAPISIGGLGTGSLLYVSFYSLVGVPETLSFALSLVKQGVIYLGSLPGGVLWLRAGRQKRPATIEE
ncbi:lysylphosphatidylglycerol synthase transmembrane domain-containing protein [Anaerolineales bacterium HSG6]|nr:lysylphosphatidylglycerol synthase transmembrane domain-containing protein [Anaerolineales bacterium HSG6]MDM8532598.1 lysylphosphatidylglycerol synthase transmembrane domain-containing protein [Anaerolineales bacterium HSG25]